jgi:hypothetical protein
MDNKKLGDFYVDADEKFGKLYIALGFNDIEMLNNYTEVKQSKVGKEFNDHYKDTFGIDTLSAIDKKKSLLLKVQKIHGINKLQTFNFKLRTINWTIDTLHSPIELKIDLNSCIHKNGNLWNISDKELMSKCVIHITPNYYCSAAFILMNIGEFTCANRQLIGELTFTYFDKISNLDRSVNLLLYVTVIIHESDFPEDKIIQNKN